MPNRDQDPEGGASQEDGYGWLYEGAPSRAESEQGPARPADGADQLPPMQLPPPGSRGSVRPEPGSSGGGKRRWPKVLAILVAAWLVFLVVVPIWAWGKITKVDAEPAGDRPSEQPGTNYLMVGSDSRKGLSKEQRKQLSTGPDSGGRGRTDTIMLMHTGSGPTLLMSIPRDSLVPVPGHGTTKINAAFAYGGPKLLVKTIEQNTGIRVDDYVEVGFGGFVNVVDAVGGIEICPTQDIKDKDAGINLKKGCQEVDGQTALGYSRSRHTYASQDLQRVQSQREVLGAIADDVVSPWTFLNPVRYVNVWSGATSSLSVGDNVGPIDMGRFGWNLQKAMGGNGLNCTVPISDTAVHWDATRAPKMFNLIKTDETDKIGKGLCTDNGLPK